MEFISTLAAILNQDAGVVTIVFIFLALLLFSSPTIHVIGWLKNRKKDEAEVHAIKSTIKINEAEIQENSTQQHVNNLMKDIENLKETNREIRKESKEDIAELKKEIVELKEEVRRLNQLIKSIDGDNIRKDSIIMMKNQEINLLRGWINKALVTSCEKCRSKFDTVPDSFEAMPGFFDNGGSYKEPQN